MEHEPAERLDREWTAVTVAYLDELQHAAGRAAELERRCRELELELTHAYACRA